MLANVLGGRRNSDVLEVFVAPCINGEWMQKQGGWIDSNTEVEIVTTWADYLESGGDESKMGQLWVPLIQPRECLWPFSNEVVYVWEQEWEPGMIACIGTLPEHLFTKLSLGHSHENFGGKRFKVYSSRWEALRDLKKAIELNREGEQCQSPPKN